MRRFSVQTGPAPPSIHTETEESAPAVIGYLRLGLALAVAWVLLSNHFQPLLLSLGAVSVVVVVWVAYRMRLVDDEGNLTAQVDGLKLMLYWPWLVFEIVKANFHVAARIVAPRVRIAPRLVSVPAPQRTALGKVIYANSITLTPGTVSVIVDEAEETILVHALTEASARDLQTGAMSRQVQSTEKG